MDVLLVLLALLQIPTNNLRSMGWKWVALANKPTLFIVYVVCLLLILICRPNSHFDFPK